MAKFKALEIKLLRRRALIAQMAKLAAPETFATRLALAAGLEEHLKMC